MGQQRVDVLAVLADAAAELQKARGQGVADDVRRARAQVAELIAAATEVRDAAWGPGKTDQPHIIRLDNALAALSTNEGGR
jgi:hypothetical protein